MNIYSSKHIESNLARNEDNISKQSKPSIFRVSEGKIKSGGIFRSSGINILGNNNDDKAINSRISNKLKTGKKLSPDELDYLRRTNPQLYMQVMRIQMDREVLEKKLKNCKSKEEAEDLIFTQMNSLNKKDANYELKSKSLQDTIEEFRKTEYYKHLPQKEKDKKDRNKNETNETSSYNVTA